MKRTLAKLSAFVVMLATGCAEDSGTGGRSVFFEVALEAPAYMVPETRFSTRSGWEVELHEAFIALGPFYLWENPPVASFEHEPQWSDLFVRSAQAHPGAGHFNGGQLRGEFLQQTVFDLHGGESLDLGEARGIAGSVRSLTVVLDPPQVGITGNADGLRSYQAYVVGTAWRGDEEVVFEGGLEIEGDAAARQVDGIPVDIELDEDHTLIVGVHPRAWFDDAQFDTLDEESASGRKWIEPDSQVGIAWRLAAKSRRSFYTRWLETAP